MDEIKVIVASATGSANDAQDQDAEAQASLEARNLVSHWASRIQHATGIHKAAFKRMKADMDLAFFGFDPELWSDEKYVVNIAQRHVQQRTAALYAKNPKAVAKPRPRLLYTVWDGSPDTINLARQIKDQAEAAQLPIPAATAELLAEFDQVQEERRRLKRIAATMEVLFHYFMQGSQPSFKSQMKALVRRMLTTGVGFVKLGFQRDMKRRPEITARMNDALVRLDHLERLAREVSKGELREGAAELEELRLSIKDLVNQENIIVREGLVFDFPDADSIIVDPLCKQLRGFVGARWIAHRMMFTPEEIKEIYGKDLKGSHTAYKVVGRSHDSSRATLSNDTDPSMRESLEEGMVCVYEIYDKPSGMVLVIADGYPDFLQEPAAPELTLETFWPTFALVCNEVEHDREIYPPSDVHLIRSMASEYNRAREGLREHRRANRPGYLTPNGMLEDEDKQKLAARRAHDVLSINGMQPGQKVEDLIAPIKTVGIDPNLYEVSTLFNDVQLAVGSQEAQFGTTSGVTATETSVAEASRMSALGAQVDELDSFMSEVARASGAVMLKEMSVQQVREIAGPGAVWPELTAQEIADEVFLEIEAGSTGKPNLAAELRNLERVLPYLIQIPGINPIWLAKEVLKRMDDKLDMDEAISEGLSSIIAMNGGSDANAPMGAGQGVFGSNNAPLSMAPGMGPTGPGQA